MMVDVMHTIQTYARALLHTLRCKLVVGGLNGNPTIGKSYIHFLHMKLRGFWWGFQWHEYNSKSPYGHPTIKKKLIVTRKYLRLFTRDSMHDHVDTQMLYQ